MIIAQEHRQDGIFERPETINERHWNEWIDSAVDPLIIRNNVTSILDSRKLDELLNRNNKRRYKHSDDLVPAWVASGVDPLSGERWLSGVQAKPDISPLREGKPQKYFGATGYEASPIFLEVEQFNYWQQVIEDTSQPIIITEGVKKAGCLLSNNYAAISIPGVSTCRKHGRLHKLLKLFCIFGRTVYLCFDNDVLTKRPVQIALLNLAKDISALGAKVMVMKIPKDAPKGIDDYVAQEGQQVIEELITTAPTVEEWKQELASQWSLQQERIKNSCRSKLAGQFKIIEQSWGEGLRFNELKNQIELHGDTVELEPLRLDVSLNFDFDMGISDAIAVVERLAKRNSYHPVREYLEECASQFPKPNLGILDDIATRYFGTEDPLHNVFMKKTLLASVARIYEPGCQHDACTVLVSRHHGIGKSSYWRELYSRAWFSDQLGEATKSEDEIAKVHQFWGLEFSEFESIYKKKDVAALKKFISAGWDVYRAPYARSSKEHPRRSVLVGSTNEEDVLVDPTGNRRFWMIPVKKRVPIQQLIVERDELWAAAYHLYQSGERWELSEAEKDLQNIANQDYRQIDPWEDLLVRFVENKEYIFQEEIFAHLEIDVSKQDNWVSRRISNIMKNLGWGQERKRFGNHRKRIWTRAEEVVTQDTSFTTFEKSKSSEKCWDSEKCRDRLPEYGEKSTDYGYKNNNLENAGTMPGQCRDSLERNDDDTFSHQPQSIKKMPGQMPGQPESLSISTYYELEKEENSTVPAFSQKPLQPKRRKEVSQDTSLGIPDYAHPTFCSNKKNKLKIKGLTGTWKVKYEFRPEYFDLNLITPTGRDIRVDDFCPNNWQITYDYLRALIRTRILELENRELLKDRTFEVQRREYDEEKGVFPVTVSGCQLLHVPSPCGGPFIFKPPHGDNFPIHTDTMEEFSLEASHVRV